MQNAAVHWHIGASASAQGRERAAEWLRANPAALESLTAKLAVAAAPPTEPERAAG